MRIYRVFWGAGDSVHSFFISYIFGSVFVVLLTRVEIDFSCLKAVGYYFVSMLFRGNRGFL